MVVNKKIDDMIKACTAGRLVAIAFKVKSVPLSGIWLTAKKNV